MSFQDQMLSPVGTAAGNIIAPSVQSALACVMPPAQVAPVALTDRKSAVIQARFELQTPPQKLGSGWQVFLGAAAFVAVVYGYVALTNKKTAK